MEAAGLSAPQDLWKDNTSSKLDSWSHSVNRILWIAPKNMEIMVCPTIIKVLCVICTVVTLQVVREDLWMMVLHTSRIMELILKLVTLTEHM